jgi:hypothetical protein
MAAFVLWCCGHRDMWSASVRSSRCAPGTRTLALMPSNSKVVELDMLGRLPQCRPSQVPAAVEDHVGGKWDSMLPINGTQDEVDAMRQALLEERALQKVTR